MSGFILDGYNFGSEDFGMMARGIGFRVLWEGSTTVVYTVV
jgi:hypothetical protein